MKKTLVSVLGFIILILSSAIVLAMPVPDTGQSKCYNTNVEIPCPSPGQPFYGQDGNYTINTPSYTKLDGSGSVLPDSAAAWSMVKDNVTGLIWENKTDDGSIHDKSNEYSWNDATFIDTLNSMHFGGYTDWRLPTIKELASIVNYSIPYPGPTIDTGYFPNTQSSRYWSSTTRAPYTSHAWGVSFNHDQDYYGDKGDSSYVRAVRGGQSGSLDHLSIGSFDAVDRSTDDVSTAASTYTDNGDGTVTDTSTDLMWQQGSSSSKTWKEAMAYCKGLNLGGHTDWRLPNIKELRSLVHHSQYRAAINTTYFPDTVSSYYWSSTSIANSKGGAWGMLFLFGSGNDDGNDGDGSSHDVRAVRGRQLGSYTDNGDGTVTDTSTDLMWQQGSSSSKTWKEATAYCEGLNLGGHTDWRLPNIKELRSLVDYSLYGTAINKTYFSDTVSPPYWSSTTYAGNTSSALSMYFYDGSAGLDDKGGSYYVRAVRGGQPGSLGHLDISPASRYVAKDAGTTTFSVSNAGTGTMTAAVISGGTWLSITSVISGTDAGTITCSFTSNITTSARTEMIRVTAPGATGTPVDVTVTQAATLNPTPTPAPVTAPTSTATANLKIVSNSIDLMSVIKITDMSGLLPDRGSPVTIRAWDKDGKQLTASGYVSPLSIINHGNTSILGVDLEDRFPDGTPAAYTFSVESSKMFITNINNSGDGAVRAPIIYSNGLSNFVSNSIGSRNTLYISEFSGTLGTGGAAIIIRAWDDAGTEIPESVSVTSYNILNYEMVKITGLELASRFSAGTPMIYEFTVNSSKVVITNVKSSSGGSISILSVYTSGINNYSTNYVSDLNTTIQITDMSGGIPTGGASITITARDVDGKLISESGSAIALKLNNYGTTTIEGDDLQNRFPGGVPVTYEFSIGSSSAVVTNLTKSSDGTINIPTVFTIGPYGGI